MFIIVLNLQVVLFSNPNNFTGIRNVVVQRKEFFSIRNIAGFCNIWSSGWNTPAKLVCISSPCAQFFKRTQWIEINESLVVNQQFLNRCIFFIGLKCKGHTNGILCIVHIERNIYVLFTSVYEQLFAFVYFDCRTIVANLNTNAAAIVLCIFNTCIIQASPRNNIAFLAVLSSYIKYQREFVISNLFTIVVIDMLQLQLVIGCNALYSFFIRNVVIQRQERIIF